MLFSISWAFGEEEWLFEIGIDWPAPTFDFVDLDSIGFPLSHPGVSLDEVKTKFKVSEILSPRK